ncbi:hypothetical protein ZTR_07359 [Talaromyces verruculosus]|nr:hypothetical protein ZTR_07359 [Talaromyces verruculosus]
MAPLTRYRADDDHVPLDFVKDYYEQRASVPGTLLITEGTFITKRAGGNRNVPGIWNDKQIEKWKEITDAVHKKGSYIFCQLWALGRAAKLDVLREENSRLISCGNIPMSPEDPAPEPLTEEEILEWIQDYTAAAKNAINAGFDGVEIHGANGYLAEQFLQDTSNNRTDSWGGSVENRSRFGFEVAKAICSAIGAGKVGYRISPWSPFQGMKMVDPVPQFSDITKKLVGLKIAYLHVVEPRISGSQTIEAAEQEVDFLIDAFHNDSVVILAGGFTADTANKVIENHVPHKVAIAFGRYFLANPDLPYRLFNGIELNPYNRDTFYVPKSKVGYIDYPFSKASNQEMEVQS